MTTVLVANHAPINYLRWHENEAERSKLFPQTPEVFIQNHLKVEDHKQSEGVWIERPQSRIIHMLCFCPFLYLQKQVDYVIYI